MSRVNRYDYATAGDLDPPEHTDEGFLRVDGRISRIGIQEYRLQDGSMRRELRLPEEVFAPASLASFEGRPLTCEHPEGRVDAKNARQLAVGNVGLPRQDGDYAKARLTIYDADAIKAAKGGKSQLSCGYSCEVDTTQDAKLIEQYGQYDSIQRKIRGNHVALVDRARAGSGAALRLDAGDAVFCGEGAPHVLCPKEKTMFKLTVGKHTYEVADANIQATVDEAINAEKARADAAQARVDSAEKKLSGIEAERDALAIRVDAAEEVKCDECQSTGKIDAKACPHCDGKGMVAKKQDTFERRVESRERSVARGAQKRADLMARAGTVLGTATKLDGLSEIEIKRQVARKHYARNAAMVARLDGEKKNDAAYIEPLYQAALDETETVARRQPAPSERRRNDELEQESSQQNDIERKRQETLDAEDPEAALMRMNQRRRDSEAKKRGGK